MELLREYRADTADGQPYKKLADDGAQACQNGDPER